MERECASVERECAGVERESAGVERECASLERECTSDLQMDEIFSLYNRKWMKDNSGSELFATVCPFLLIKFPIQQ